MKTGVSMKFIQPSITWHYQTASKHYENLLEAASVNTNIIILLAAAKKFGE